MGKEWLVIRKWFDQMEDVGLLQEGNHIVKVGMW